MRFVNPADCDADPVVVAPWLLNKLLVSDLAPGRCIGRITEVEAYREDDPASHSFRGPTARNRSMFGPPGLLYVYLIYGVHHCANVVTGPAGNASAVLLRAVEPIGGLEVMRDRRGRTPIAVGPGRLCAAMGITLAHDGVSLCEPGEVWLADDGVAPPEQPIVGPRVGISVATQRRWRWRVPA